MKEFTFEIDTNRWFSLNYQSNDALNEATHGNIKKMLAEILVKDFKIIDIHSYVHGSLIFSVEPSNVVSKYNKINEALKKPIASHSPALIFSLVLSGYSTQKPQNNYLYIQGDEEMDKHFKKSIVDFYPPKAKKETKP